MNFGSILYTVGHDVLVCNGVNLVVCKNHIKLNNIKWKLSECVTGSKGIYFSRSSCYSFLCILDLDESGFLAVLMGSKAFESESRDYELTLQAKDQTVTLLEESRVLLEPTT